MRSRYGVLSKSKMTKTIETPDTPASIAAAKTSLRRNAALAADHVARKAAKSKEIIGLVGGEDLAAMALRDPAAARTLRGKIALLQSEAAVDELIVGGLEAQLMETGVMVIGDTRGKIAAASKVARENLEVVSQRILSQLRGLNLFDEARLPRIAGESMPVRTEGGACHAVNSLSVGASGACSDGKGGIYYETLSAVSICNAHDMATAALGEVTARAKELQRSAK